MANKKVAAPPSDNYNRGQRIATIRQLRAKATSSRSVAETKQLVDTLVSMLPHDVQQALQ